MKGGKSLIKMNKLVTKILKYYIAIRTTPTGEGVQQPFPPGGK
jgi:hypothetical protein